METTNAPKKPSLIQVWEEWDEADKKTSETEGPKLCKVDNPDCEACQ